MITLSDVINAIEAKKELSDSSKKNYCDYLKNFSNGLKATDMKKMFMDFEKFDKFLKAKSNKANSLKSWFTAINAIFKIYPKLQIPEAIVKKYFDEMMKYSASSKTAAKQNIPAPNQVDKDDNIIPWSKIVDLNKLFTGDKFASRDHLIIAMYTLIPPRRLEYRELYYLKSKPDDDKGALNYIYMDESNKMHMVLNVFKTATRAGKAVMGPYKTVLPSSLRDIILAYIKKSDVKNAKPLFRSNRGAMFSESRFSTEVSRVFSKYLGSPVTVGDLRHLHNSSLDMNKLTSEEKEQISVEMGHSTGMQDEYRKLPKKKSSETQKEEEANNDQTPVESVVEKDFPEPATVEKEAVSKTEPALTTEELEAARLRERIDKLTEIARQFFEALFEK